ncbi:hypothetical protein MTO96_030778 [Rhipicephalus appendiculatus]
MRPVYSPGSRTEAPAAPLRPPETRVSGSNSAQGGLLRIERDGPLWPPRPPSRSDDPGFASPSRAAAAARSPSVHTALRPGSIYVEIETESTPQGSESAPPVQSPQGLELRSDLPLVVPYEAGSGSWSSSRRRRARRRRRRAAARPSAKLERNTASYWVLGLTIVCLVSASALLMTLMNRGYLGALANATASPTSAHPRVIQTDEPLPGDPKFKVDILFRPTTQTPPAQTTMRTPPFFTLPSIPPGTTALPIGVGEGETPPLPEPAPPAGGWLDYDALDRNSTEEPASNATSDDGGVTTEAADDKNSTQPVEQLLGGRSARPGRARWTAGGRRRGYPRCYGAGGR